MMPEKAGTPVKHVFKKQQINQQQLDHEPHMGSTAAAETAGTSRA
jgi:hypothetical protein